ncbi:hypothetical protein C4564_04635 [Candidatus Microgenomates bacterium]|nr:MAG: hypothetical protein C4564_04635 [Candidatus Microgenomates bacterium]
MWLSYSLVPASFVGYPDEPDRLILSIARAKDNIWPIVLLEARLPEVACEPPLTHLQTEDGHKETHKNTYKQAND